MTAEPTVVPEFDLSTTYLGLQLRSPLVASSGPLTARIDSLRALEQAGVAAVVLPSLFEEQIEYEDMEADRLSDFGTDSNPEASGYFPDLGEYESVADRYVRHLEEAKKALSIPVVASLNGVSPGGWVRYARLLERAGADALELNLYGVAADIYVTGREVEDRQVELVDLVKSSLSIPLAVKIGPYYSALGHQVADRRGWGRCSGAVQPLLPARHRPPNPEGDTGPGAVVVSGAAAASALDRHLVRARPGVAGRHDRGPHGHGRRPRSARRRRRGDDDLGAAAKRSRPCRHRRARARRMGCGVGL